MPNTQLAEYVQKARAGGMPDAQIRQLLQGAGWPEQEIAQAMGAIPQAARSADVPDTARKHFPKVLGIAIVVVFVLAGGGWGVYAKFGVPPVLKAAWEKIMRAVPMLTSKIKPVPSPAGSPSPIASPVASASAASTLSVGATEARMQKFASDDAYKIYMQEAAANGAYGGLGGSFFGAGQLMTGGMPAQAPMPMTAPNAEGAGRDMGNGGVERVSQTNVQVQNVDEPDIVKTDGKEIYFSPRSAPVMYGAPGIEDELSTKPMPLVPAPQPPQQGTSGQSSSYPPNVTLPPVDDVVRPYPYPTPTPPETKIVKAFPVAELAKVGGIAKTGNLLLAGSTLMVLPDVQNYYGYGSDQGQVTAYDVADPRSPKEIWKLNLQVKTLSDAAKNAAVSRDIYPVALNRLIASRLTGGKLYLIIASNQNVAQPCPIMPLMVGGQSFPIPCSDIYYPTIRVPADAVYTALVVDPKTGKVERHVSFIGSANSSVVYMSAQSLYVTYPHPKSYVDMLYGFLQEKGQGLIPQDLLDRLGRLRSYDISEQARLTELAVLMEKFQISLDADQRLKMENELANRAKAYFRAHARELEDTVVVKISLGDFSVVGTGTFPGEVLNQFLLDEYNGYLRIAATIGGSGMMGMFGGNGIAESANDVYVLGNDLRIVGSVKDLGLGERIYAARFVEDRGYLVTFRQTDPFYVLDMSDPASPQRKGELKIPGFSSYLHPIAKNLVLGVGQEGSQVKLALFDVSDAANPAEKDKYLLSEYWTDVSNTHHAFLLDDKHQVFFLPGSMGGYVFSYKDNHLSIQVAFSDFQVRRAIYINDYLYILSDSKIAVYDEKEWAKVNELNL